METKNIKLNENEVDRIFEKLKPLAYRIVSASKANLSDIKEAWLIDVFKIKREFPEFAKYLEKGKEELLKKLAAKVGGSISFIGGTTEFDVPTFLRNSYEMSESEFYGRITTPEKFKTIEIFVMPTKIEQRFLWFQREGKRLYHWDYLITDKNEFIEKTDVTDDEKIYLNQISQSTEHKKLSISLN